jgi:hypothetical protein
MGTPENTHECHLRLNFLLARASLFSRVPAHAPTRWGRPLSSRRFRGNLQNNPNACSHHQLIIIEKTRCADRMKTCTYEQCAPVCTGRGVYPAPLPVSYATYTQCVSYREESACIYLRSQSQLGWRDRHGCALAAAGRSRLQPPWQREGPSAASGAERSLQHRQQ